MFRSTPEGEITFSNAAFMRHYGLFSERSDNDDDKVAFDGAKANKRTFPIPAVDRTVVLSKIQRLSKDEPVFDHEQELKLSGLESRWFQWTVRGIFSDGDQLDELQWVGRDVTDRIRLMERLNTIDKIESLGVFAGGIAHDFNNYLTSIMGTITLMKRGMDPKDPRYQRLDDAERLSSKPQS